MDPTRIASLLQAQLVDDLFFGDPQARLLPDDDLFELGLDSLGITRLVVFAERRLGVRIPDEDVVRENFRSMAALLAMLERRRP